MRDIWKLIGATGAVKIYAAVLSAGILFITARTLGPEGRGMIATIMSVNELLAMTLSFSLGQIAINHAAKEKGQAWLAEILPWLSIICLVMTALGWIGLAVTYIFTKGAAFSDIPPHILAVGALILLPMLWEQYGSNLLMAIQKLTVYNLYKAAGQTTALIAIVILVGVMGGGVIAALCGLFIGHLIMAAGGLKTLFGGLETRPVLKKDTLKFLIGGGLILHANAIGGTLVNTSDILMVNYFMGPEFSGYYQMAVRLVGVFILIPQAASMVIYSKVAELGADQAWLIQRKILFAVLGLLATGALIIGLTAGWWLPLLAGDDFNQAIPVFQLRLLALLPMGLATLMAPQWIGRGWFWQAALLTATSGLLNVLANAWLIPHYGMFGAVWATLAVYGIGLCVNIAVIIICERQILKQAL